MARRSAGLTVRKDLAEIRREGETHGLHRTLGPIQLVLLGIGAIVGAGVYVMTGTAAALYAGPAVVLSFIVAGVACALTGLCYAELASTLPVSGSSYTYTYASLGEVYAWGLGWLLMFEYGLAGSALSVGLSGYLTSLLADFGITIPAAINTPLVQSHVTADGLRLTVGGSANLVAAASLFVVAGVLVRGIAHSAAVNTIMVIVKLAVLITFVAVGAGHIHTANWHPFVPPNEGGFSYGAPGVLRAASMLFFAYLGFETVSTAALEARNPQRDMPIGILGSLAICTVIYIAVGLVLTGLVSYRSLGVPDPIAVAINSVGMPALAVFIKIGALAGLSSVLLVNTYGHSRICYAMSRDGLLPELFSTVHARFRTPHQGTIVVAALAALAGATLPISILGDMVSLGTASAFAIVAISVMWLRGNAPDLHRPFRVPLGGVTVGRLWLGVIPVAALVFCLVMVAPVLIDIAARAIAGEWIPAMILIVYVIVGVALYVLYGHRKSRLGQAAPQNG
jgi:APA family basic amino acid/polyamine antiporter